VIVHPAALVNHVLPYAQLFGPNVVGTAELIGLALTRKMKRFVIVSTVAVAFGERGQVLDEDADVRAAVLSRSLQSGPTPAATPRASGPRKSCSGTRTRGSLCRLPTSGQT
jgi:thioester reductase-like protein